MHVCAIYRVPNYFQDSKHSRISEQDKNFVIASNTDNNDKETIRGYNALSFDSQKLGTCKTVHATQEFIPNKINSLDLVAWYSTVLQKKFE